MVPVVGLARKAPYRLPFAQESMPLEGLTSYLGQNSRARVPARFPHPLPRQPVASTHFLRIQTDALAQHPGCLPFFARMRQHQQKTPDATRWAAPPTRTWSPDPAEFSPAPSASAVPASRRSQRAKRAGKDPTLHDRLSGQSTRQTAHKTGKPEAGAAVLSGGIVFGCFSA